MIHVGWRIGIATVAIGLLNGCSLVGPSTLDEGRTRYNQIIAKTADEQTLLNLVKLRYAERPTMLEVTTISSNIIWGTGINAQGGITGRPELGYIAGHLNYSESPTITYSPLRGENFVKQILAPLPVDTVILLIQSGWAVDHVLRLTVQEMNHLRNITVSSYVDQDEEMAVSEFERALQLMRTLQIEHALEWALPGSLDQQFPTMDLYLREDSENQSAQIKELRELLQLDPNISIYSVLYGVGSRDKKTLTMVTHSISDMLFYLSQAVAVPQEDIDSGVAVRYPRGAREFWQHEANSLLRVQYSETRPENALVTVQYRGLYFFIADNDIHSKWTFLLLQMLINLKSGDMKGVSPVLTIPVGR